MTENKKEVEEKTMNEAEVHEQIVDNTPEDENKMAYGPGEAVAEKRELTPEEQQQHARMVIAQETIDKQKELEELIDVLNEKGLLDHAYGPDSVVEIPGSLFAHILSFMATVEDHNFRVKSILASIADAGDSVSLGALDFRLELIKLHQENCEKGITKSQEEIEAEAAEKNIQEVPTGQSERKGKARGVDASERDLATEEE